MAKKRISKTGVGFLIDASAKTYETPEKQIREFISNSLDAGASKVVIHALPDVRKLIIIDNGSGMDDREFDENYLVIGCSKKFGDRDTIGRIGVGKFSAIPLCNNLLIRTRKSGSPRVYQANLELAQLRDPKNRTKDVQKLVLGDGDYVESAVDDPDTSFSASGSFTKMILSDVDESVMELFTDDGRLGDFTNNLGRILPLKYDSESEAIKKLFTIEPELCERLIQQAEKTNVGVIIYTPEQKKGIELYRTLFGDDFAETGQKIQGNVFPVELIDDSRFGTISIAGYFADMTKGSKENAIWRGLNVRIKNTTVVEGYFFDYGDAQPCQRITGEIHIWGVNEEELITMNRAGFATTHPEYRLISDWMTEKLASFGKIVRRRTDFNSDMNRKTAQLRNQAMVAERIEKTIREVFHDEKPDLCTLSKNQLKKEDEIDQEEELKKEFPEQIQEIIPVSDATSDKIESRVIDADRHSVMIPEGYLNYRITIDDVEFVLKYVNHEEEEPIVDFDFDAATIRINKHSAPIRNGQYRMVLALVLIEYAFAVCQDDPEKLKNKLYDAILTGFSD